MDTRVMDTRVMDTRVMDTRLSRCYQPGGRRPAFLPTPPGEPDA